MAANSELRAFLKNRLTSGSDWNLTGVGRDIGKYKVEEKTIIIF